MDDLIKRQDAIDAIYKESKCANSEVSDEYADMFVYALKTLPSAQKTGKWIECCASEHWKCSECGCRAGYWFNEENSSSYDLDMSEWLSDYCPNCGAYMRGEEE